MGRISLYKSPVYTVLVIMAAVPYVVCYISLREPFGMVLPL